jgi:hypothetical protein
MASYPALTEMGITNTQDIERYSLQTNNNVDVLRVVYKRKKGELLHSSKKFRFGRAQKMVVTDAGQNKTAVVHEISPFVIKVTDELRSLVKSKLTREEQMAVVKEELSRLEEETNTRIAYIQTLVSKCE